MDEKMHKESYSQNLKGIVYFVDPDVDSKLALKLILKK
jgi:hypothetical protein